MCISANVSLSTFFISVFSSIILIYYGKKQYSIENIIIGLFFIYIAGVQLFEYFMWVNSGEINHILTLILPLYIYHEPLVLFHLKMWFLNKTQYIWQYIVETIYFIEMCINWYDYYKKKPNDITVSSGNNGLFWKWSSFMNWNLYNLFFTYSVFVYFPLRISILLFFLGILFNIISIIKRKNNSGTLWCLLSAFIPIFMLVLE